MSDNFSEDAIFCTRLLRESKAEGVAIMNQFYQIANDRKRLPQDRAEAQEMFNRWQECLASDNLDQIKTAIAEYRGQQPKKQKTARELELELLARARKNRKH